MFSLTSVKGIGRRFASFCCKKDYKLRRATTLKKKDYVSYFIVIKLLKMKTRH